jgi:hypothetical protein
VHASPGEFARGLDKVRFMHDAYVVEVRDAACRHALASAEQNLLWNISNSRRDFCDEELVQDIIGRVARQQQYWATPNWFG